MRILISRAMLAAMAVTTLGCGSSPKPTASVPPRRRLPTPNHVSCNPPGMMYCTSRCRPTPSAPPKDGSLIFKFATPLRRSLASERSPDGGRGCRARKRADYGRIQKPQSDQQYRPDGCRCSRQAARRFRRGSRRRRCGQSGRDRVQDGPAHLCRVHSRQSAKPRRPGVDVEISARSQRVRGSLRHPLASDTVGSS